MTLLDATTRLIHRLRPLTAGLGLVLAACSGGQYSVPEGDSAGPGPSQPGDGGGEDCASVFAERVQPRLDFCRTCHIPDGVGDVEEGRLFMLAEDESQDLDNLRASWERLGGNNPVSRILLMASGTDSRSHSGGSPWPEGSAAYQDVEAFLLGFDDPSACRGAAGADPGPDTGSFPLLGSKHGGHIWGDFCASQPDSAPLPVDPRTLVQAGANEGLAVHYNIEWRDCRADPELVQEDGHPTTCGEWREKYAIGERVMRGNGAVGSGNFFAGDSAGGAEPFAFTVSAEEWSSQWQSWGVFSRPENFDYLVSQRFGAPLSSVPNPYPLAGEDPNASNGGSGQLPIAFTQTREADGSWSGRIGLTCHGCHSGAAGTEADGPGLGVTYGSGSSLNDVAVVARDLGFASQSPIAAFSLFGTSRGTNNASDVNVFVLLEGFQPDPNLFGVLTSGSTGSMDTPAWWNLGHRPAKFIDGYFPADASRVDLIFYTPLSGDPVWVRAHAQAADIWATSLKSPAWPRATDTGLAEQGAILFHTKDLWGSGLDNPVPRPPEGNGSCASCHGAYSPRFANDPRFLEDPSLEGVAAYIVPPSIIGTDMARLQTNNDAVNEYGANTFLGFSETIGTPHDCGPLNRPSVRGEREPGYLTPPLYGVWATAPYLHNGSVPDLWGVLDPDSRPEIWKRVSTPAPEGAGFGVIMGFDTDIDRAYDAQRGGWRYEEIQCASGSTTIPLVDCDLLPVGEDPLVQMAADLLYGSLIAGWNVGNVRALAEFTPQQIEDRKIYNTHLYSQGNQGHAFTAVLTDAERQALIEYLKTL